MTRTNRLVLLASLGVIAVGLAGGATWYLVHGNHQGAPKGSVATIDCQPGGMTSGLRDRTSSSGPSTQSVQPASGAPAMATASTPKKKGATMEQLCASMEQGMAKVAAARATQRRSTVGVAESAAAPDGAQASAAETTAPDVATHPARPLQTLGGNAFRPAHRPSRPHVQPGPDPTNQPKGLKGPG